ncbi:LOW QUALITY PROTEIN: Endogenous retrovirus group FC1 Env polyprotein [Plecturocebus cupreus]
MCPASSWPPKMISRNPNPWAPLASASPVAPTRHPLTLQSLLLTVLLISPLEANSYVWRFYSQESWVEGPTTRTQYIAQADCQPPGCQSAVIIEIEKTKTKTLQASSPTPGYASSMTKNMTIVIGGTPLMEDVLITPVKYTRLRSAMKPKTTAKIASRYSSPPYELFLTIRDPWDDRWVKGVTGKIYNFWLNSHPQGTWLI